jgi:ParB-like nuclease domain
MMPDDRIRQAAGAIHPAYRTSRNPMECHEIANLFPMMPDEQIEELAADIAEHGLREPIVLLDGKIIDGRHRYQACVKAGVRPEFTDYSGIDPVACVISRNLRRRHLDQSQRAMVAAALATMKQGARTDLAPNGAMSDASAAKLLNVGERSVERAKAVRRNAVPEVIVAVKQGDVAVSAALEFSKQSKEEQREKVRGAGNAAVAVKFHRRTGSTSARKESAVGASANPASAKKKLPRWAKQDPDLFYARRCYEAIQSLTSEPVGPAVFWRCVEVYDVNDIARDLDAVVQMLTEIREAMPVSTRH